MSDLPSELEAIGAEARVAVEAAASLEALKEVRVRFLGRRSRLNEILRSVPTLSDTDKRVVGAAGNRLRQELGAAVEARRAALEAQEVERLL
ncbi:MAG: phenylalanine--tRNA ligase subunit alpha, partial [Candidatus Binatia bacterium]